MNQMPIERCILPDPIQPNERKAADEKAHFELICGMITSIVAATLPYKNCVYSIVAGNYVCKLTNADIITQPGDYLSLMMQKIECDYIDNGNVTSWTHRGTDVRLVQSQCILDAGTDRVEFDFDEHYR